MIGDWRTHRILGLTYGEFTWLVLGFVALGYELWAVATRDGDVLTRAWRANSLRWIVIPFGMGVLCGHLNGPSLPYFAKWSPLLFAVLVFAAFMYGLVIRTPVPDAYRPVLFGFGFMVGILCWSGRP